MSQLLRKSFKSHRRAHSTPPVSLVTATDKNPRNTLPTVKATLTEVPEHEELRSGGTRHGSLDFNAPMSVVPRSVDEAKIGLAKYSTQTSARVSLPKNRDWLRLQQTIRNLFKTKNVPLEPGEMAVLHEKIRTLISSKAGPFLFDSFKREIEVCFAALLQRLQEVPNLLNTDAGYVVPDGIRHMLLILYNVSDSYPPTKTKLKLEGMLARILNPFLGFQGLYEGTPEPTVKSAEPEVASRRKSADGVPLPRKLSRPMSSQPRQIETLHELFLTALRKQPDF
ncbi:uncharacterized protein LOC144124833 isoform X2 [Amblyomma americanum]